MRVMVYVEGDSDRAALGKALEPLVAQFRTGLTFIPLRSKDEVLDSAPRRAAYHLLDSPEDLVFVLPDLYPMAQYDGTDKHHRSVEQLQDYLRAKFSTEADSVGLAKSVRSRFYPHALKHDLEALCLASTNGLQRRLGLRRPLKGAWRLPVAEQNDDQPPRRIIESLFRKHRNREYAGPVDAPLIIAATPLDELVAACPEGFGRLVAALKLALKSQPEGAAARPRSGRSRPLGGRRRGTSG